MKKEERLQQQCDVCGRLLDKNISNFRKYSRKTNGLNFHTTCRDCEDRIKLNTEWKDGKLLCHICGEYKEPSEFTYAGANKYTLRQNKECRCNSCKLEQRKAAIATYDNDVKLEKVLQARWLAAKSRAIDKSIPFTTTKEDLLTVWKAQNGKCAISGLDMTYELGEGRIYTNVSTDRSSTLEVNSSDQAVMDTVKSNMTNNIPFQLLYYGVTSGGGLAQSLPVSLHGVPLANIFTLYVGINSTALTRLSINKTTTSKWTASTLSTT